APTAPWLVLGGKGRGPSEVEPQTGWSRTARHPCSPVQVPRCCTYSTVLCSTAKVLHLTRPGPKRPSATDSRREAKPCKLAPAKRSTRSLTGEGSSQMTEDSRRSIAAG